LFGPLLFVDHDSTVVLKNVTITNFANFGGIDNPGGSGVSNAGTLSIINSTFSNNDFFAIGNEGTLTIGNSTFSHNGHCHSESCSGIRNDGILTVSYGGIANYPTYRRTITFDNDSPQTGTKTATVVIFYKNSSGVEQSVTLSMIFTKGR
jgi:hypothetical protein